MKLVTGRITSRLLSKPGLIAALLFGIGISVSALFMANESERLKQVQSYQLHIKLGTLRARLEGAINSNLMVLGSVESEIELNPQITQAQFARRIQNMLNDEVHFRHVALAPDLVISHIYPLAGNEKAIGLDYRKVPDQLAAIEDAIAARRTVIAGPVNLVQGGTAFIARVPVWLESERRFWGIIAAVIKDKLLLQEAGIQPEMWGASIAMRTVGRDQREGQVFYGDESTFADGAIIQEVKLPAGSWQIAALPNAAQQSSTGRIGLLWGVALVLSFILAAAGYFVTLSYRGRLAAMETANYRANYDGLTGLANRRYFNQQLQGLLQNRDRSDINFALFFIDLDRFKQVNDTWGHQAGDELLQSVAERIRQCVRQSDIVARLAGDEFVTVMKDVALAPRAELLAEKILQKLNEPYHIGGQDISISSSIGIAIYPDDGMDAEGLLVNADRAMYAAKRNGRNRIYFFNDGLRREAEQHVRLHNDILTGIREGQFVVHYQPLLNLATQQIEKCEALVRWQHPDSGLIGPGGFIETAEMTGAIRDLGNWVLDQACRDIGVMKGRGHNLNVAINRSLNEFSPVNVASTWLNTIRRHHVSPDQIVFEITESVFMDDQKAQLSKISELRSAGIRFAIDDFGTGYSALNYLRSYPADFLKIDRSFVADLTTDEQDRTLVEVIIKMGKTLGIEVVAEGVEEPEQEEILKSFGCEYTQGYLLARPMPLHEFIEFCDQHYRESAGVTS